MGSRFPGQACVFCPNPSVGVGEHVWPAWFIAEFHGQGPFTTSRAGVPYTKRDGKTPLTADALFGVHVPACEECNAALDTTIEKPAKPVVRRLLTHADSMGELILSADDCAALARWLLKVGLLSAHPAAEHDHPGLQRDTGVPRLATIRPEWLDWIRTGAAPPDGFSVFLTRRDLRGEDPAAEIEQHIILPKLVVDGEDRDFMSRSFGFAGVNVAIVWHPGWPLQHAQVDAGRAVLLWPHPDEVDFGAVPQVSPKELAFWDGSIGSIRVTADQLARIAQRPLSVDSDPIQAFFGSIAESAP
ncbi:hypothetical protein ACH3VR_22675 [Microbacterium sp. B2969]|uniref:HNH endonuclease n=1 Tax=Microbacterium alkaliflavum TaxID=3248839 RepID=A0ABW7QFP4_9MICO